MAQDTNLNTLIINKMTKAQYNAAEKSDSELYMVTDETYYTADEVDQKLANVSVDLSGYAKETYVDQKVADLVGSSPDTLNTLNELASALGNDPNFATTITNQLAQKADKSYVDETAYKNSLPQININKPSKNDTINTATNTYAKALARKTIDSSVKGLTKVNYSLDTQNYIFYFADDEHDTTQLQDDIYLYNSLDKTNFYKPLLANNSYILIFDGGKKYCYLRLICHSIPDNSDFNITINYIDFDSIDPMIKMTTAETSLAYNKTKIITVNEDIIQNYSSEDDYDIMMDVPLGYMPYSNTGVQVRCNNTNFYFKIVYDDTLTFPSKSGTIALQEDVDLKANTADLAQVAKTGSFTDLNNIPSIPSVETTATENSTNAISSGYVYTLEDKLTNGTGGYKVMTAEYADNVPVISTNISTDAESDIKTASPKAVKSYVDGNVVANPTLTGSETSLTSIGIGGTNFSVGGSSGGGYDFSNITPIVGTWDATNLWYSTSYVEFTVNKKYSHWNEGTRRSYDLTEYIANGAKALYIGCARFNSSSSSGFRYSQQVGTPDNNSADNKNTNYGWKMIPLNIPFTITELLASFKKNDGTISSFLQAEYNPSTHKINIYVYGFNSETGSGTTSWYAHYFILAIY